MTLPGPTEEESREAAMEPLAVGTVALSSTGASF